MSLITRILVIILSLIIMFLGGYLWTHRKKKFLVFSPADKPSLSTTLAVLGGCLMVAGLATLFTSFMANLVPFLWMIVIDVILATIMTFTLLIYLFAN
ncbi:hypothetical protein [Ligilactobacillus aviarius]|uniref:DUF3784 domain-containing protein n=1 Tax=Ligilactobacillus aviarius TaxID=1606 RepID=A0A179C5C4_9LACO|nr:hypothetical protein [Ligilactobacillus aviarius]OAP99035.1 hypothetical protein A3O07_05040 [Ligilactobacillus aviarius]OAQ00123.1 hypothetical protein A3O08_03840 [Ligilactobacillus aviarius]OAQ01735.1 hypothetical protein A3O09_01500 [Ligilactobacillus aviarius]OAQ04456.1 hypothetical protein A3O13_05345 [Ligilactobacillus aviarius]OAQ07802.1 hypothetical protein A3O14_05500 [Ligilactobacillus aviarius]